MQETSKLEGIIIMGHGSKSPSALATLREVTAKIDDAYDIPVRLASLQFNRPTFEETIDELVRDGVERIIVMPFFIYSGIHVTEDIPIAISGIVKKYSHIEIVMTGHLGADTSIIGVVKDRINTLTSTARKPGSTGKLLPHEIESKSYEIIHESYPGLGSESLESEVKSRIMHASGDLGIEKDIIIGPKANEIVSSVTHGGPVITDVMMVMAGISRGGLSEYGCPLYCYIGDEDVATKAKELSMTRAATAIRKAFSLHEGGIYVIGNAPTALEELCGAVEDGSVRPDGIIGIPVGFVGAAEAKMRLMSLDIPWITIKGARGGSAVAAAAINAVIRTALKKD